MTNNEWQPIETAPKDGTYILVYPGYYTKVPCSIAYYDDDKYAKRPQPYWHRLDTRGLRSRYTPLTHWMPLPCPPYKPDPPFVRPPSDD